ncbi:MAG TPA: DUF4350 domain-containing protein [Pedococcus sp.]
MTLEVWDRPDALPGGAGGDASGAPTDRHGSRSRWPGGRRRATVIAAATLAFLLVVLGALALRGRSGADLPLDPGNARPAGGQALARVLEQEGLALDVARGQADLLDLEEPGPATTVVITRTQALSEETAATALDHARGARRVVLVEPDTFLLQSLGLPVDPSGGAASTRSVRADCAVDGIAPTDTISSVGRGYTTTDPSADTCFTFERSSALVTVPARGGAPEVVVLGAGEILSNREVTRYDNAGVSVRLLGRGDRLVWYVPDPRDVALEDTTPTSEIPRALGPLVLLGLAALLATMLWRGRRFGPLVTEPLPAVVKAIETTQSRGRLYRRAKDTARAGSILRTATCGRLGRYLGLPAGAPPRAVAGAAARATGRPFEHVRALLDGPPPATEDALVALATDLSTLEKEVHRP